MQDMGWHDDVHHNSRVLSSRLATDAALVHAVIVGQAGLMVQIACTLISGD